VGAPDGVRAGECDHVGGGEVHGREARDELGQVEEGRGKVGDGPRGVGDAAFEAARRHGEPDPAHYARGVAHHEGETVPGQRCSTTLLARSMTAKPRGLGKLGGAVFSTITLPGLPVRPSSSSNTSQPSFGGALYCWQQ
jgi:hypothetical protein